MIQICSNHRIYLKIIVIIIIKSSRCNSLTILIIAYNTLMVSQNTGTFLCTGETDGIINIILILE